MNQTGRTSTDLFITPQISKLLSQKKSIPITAKPNISKVENKNTHFVCLDTNIVISLSMCWFANNGKTCQNEARQIQTKSKGMLQTLIEEKKINAIITPYVLQEIYVGLKKYGGDCIEYIKNNNVFVLDIPKEKDVYYFEDVENLALRYCGRCKSPYAPHPREGRNRDNQIFPLEYRQKIKRPDIDARIMAEATLLGCPLLTLNTKHFIDEQKYKKIARINKELGLGGIMPYTPWEYNKLLGENHQLSKLKSEYGCYLKQSKEADL